MKTLSVKVPETLDARLAALARRRKTSRSQIVRQALTRYLSSQEPSSTDSFLDLARDLVGCGSGPPDLSTAKKHLTGYAR